MPRYYFDLVDDRTVYDSKGVSLPNEIAAKEYAATFARELMETKKRASRGNLGGLEGSGQQWPVQADPRCELGD